MQYYYPHSIQIGDITKTEKEKDGIQRINIALACRNIALGFMVIPPRYFLCTDYAVEVKMKLLNPRFMMG